MVTARIETSIMSRDASVECRRFWAARGVLRERRHFSGGRRSSPPPVTSTPRETDPAVQEAEREAAARRKSARGYRSTILGSMYQRGSTGTTGGSNQPGTGQTFGA
jgi:hypothetical protein